MKHKDLVGMRFGRLYVTKKVESDDYRSRFLCVCDCGSTKIVLGQNLLNGHTQSCGCIHAEKSKKRIENYNRSENREEHGETKTRLYSIWEGMKTRCYSKTHHSFPNYGGRGIYVCNEWKNSYIAFRNWSMENGYNDTLSIDRIDVNGNYEPLNCRWVDASAQAANKRLLARNTTGYTGVSFNKRMGKYVAYIGRNGNNCFLGYFDNIEDAINARKDAEKS